MSSASHCSANSSFDVVIIGAGMSGLAAGIRLALFGKKVVILERHYAIGGLNGYYTLNGVPYDVGLHAVTNFSPKGAKKVPLTKILRQLRLNYEELDLNEQVASAIKFPGVTMQFSNQFELLRSQIAEKFPRQIDAFQRLVATIEHFDELNLENPPCSAQSILDEHLTDPLLKNMLLLPLMYYGNPAEHDMDWTQFVIMFKSIYQQGFARPYRGVRHILDLLKAKYKSLGGELWLKSEVKSLVVRDQAVTEVLLTDGTCLQARHVLSSAGRVETAKLLSSKEKIEEDPLLQKDSLQSLTGQLSFVEAIAVFQQQPKDLGINDTILFFNDSEALHYQNPTTAVDFRSGVICCPNQYQYANQKSLPHGILRATALANPTIWKNFDQKTYQETKEAVWKQLITNALAISSCEKTDQSTAKLADLTLVSKDIFTPKTIERFTSHINGTIYGSPNKIRTGKTALSNLHLCGTDQGFLGIVGAILSGISIANLHVLSVKPPFL